MKPMPLRAIDGFGLSIEKVSDVLPPTNTDAAPKDFVIVGGATTTRSALALFPVPPLAEMTLPVVLV